MTPRLRVDASPQKSLSVKDGPVTHNLPDHEPTSIHGVDGEVEVRLGVNFAKIYGVRVIEAGELA